MRNGPKPDRSAGQALWRFSLALYARPRVAEALLALQDRAGRDVNLILFALWLGATQRRRITPAELAVAAAAIAPLNAGVVHRLRRLRSDLKTTAGSGEEAVSRRILAIELAAERQVQYRLAAAAAGCHSGCGTGLAAAAANLALTLGDAAQSAEADVLRQAVAALTRAA